MGKLVRDDEITVLPICQPSGQAPAQADEAWSARVREISASHIVISVRTSGGTEVTMEASLSGVRQDASGRWQLVLPMFHRLVS
jgi:hypothetical protein